MRKTGDELENILHGEGRKEMLQSYQDLKESLGAGGASERAAEIVINTKSP